VFINKILQGFDDLGDIALGEKINKPKETQ
jgi:hypothetical protein